MSFVPSARATRAKVVFGLNAPSDVLIDPGKTEKPMLRSDNVGVSLGINLSADTSRLEVCFGGFAPTVMNGGAVVNDIVDKAEEFARERRRSNERLAAVEAARASEPRVWYDVEGTEWTYVVLDGTEVRIEKCKTSVAHLLIPAEIEGLAVVSLAADACAYLPSLESVTCPDSLLSIGYCAFRGCKNLKVAKLPLQVSNYDSGWFRACEKLEELFMPGRLQQIEMGLFDNASIKCLHIGEGTISVAPGAFGKSCLTSIAVDEANPFMASDGLALYSAGYAVMLALAVPVASYRVQEGCKALARKAFSGFSCLEGVDLPDSVEAIDGFAFFKTGLRRFAGPASLRSVGEKAFFNCRNLEQVTFGEGLVSLGENAFTGTRIRELRLPSTIAELGNPIAAGVNLVYAGPDATFSIAPGENALQLDEEGGLYREDEAGLSFVALLNPDAQRYEVREGTAKVAEGAFAGHVRVAEVVLPESVSIIERAAFKGARGLRRVNIPEGVTVIDDEAFLDTNIESVYLPGGLERLGVNALVTQGAHYSASVKTALVEPSLRSVSIGAGNTRYLVEGGLLFERAGTDDTLRVLLCTGGVDVVRIPAQVNEIAPYAFNNVRGIRELYLSDRIVMVGIRGLAVDGFVELIHVDLVKEQYGRGSFDLRFPGTDRGMQQMMLALSVPDHVNVEVMFEHYDTAITNGSSFDAATEKGLALYDQATRLLDRLSDPIFLSEVNRSLCERFLANNVEAVCVALAKHDDRVALDAMLDMGFLNADNIYAVIERIGAVQDASITNYLLEARRQRFEQSVFDDFDL